MKKVKVGFLEEIEGYTPQGDMIVKTSATRIKTIVALIVAVIIIFLELKNKWADPDYVVSLNMILILLAYSASMKVFQKFAEVMPGSKIKKE